jgi:O-methyltransferase
MDKKAAPSRGGGRIPRHTQAARKLACQADSEEYPTRHRLDPDYVCWSKTEPKNRIEQTCGLGPSKDPAWQQGSPFGEDKMDDFFITEYFDWKVRRNSYIDRFTNRVLSKIGLRIGSPASFLLDRIDSIVERIEGRTISPLLSGRMTNVEQRINMYHLVSQVLAYDVDGDFVELGCNSGQSSVLITKIIRFYNSDKKLFVYDSFEGLPSLSPIDGSAYYRGQLKTTEDALRYNFDKYNLPLPEIHRGWFSDTLPNGLPDKISFAYLDGDLYDSILISLEHVYPRLTKGAICLIDDYGDPSINPVGWNKLPGVKKACDEYLSNKPEKMTLLYAADYTHGFFRKA